MLSVCLPSTWNISSPTVESRDPTFFINQFFEPVTYAEASCGNMWNQNLAPQVNCALAEDPGVYLGEEIYNLLEQQVSESSDIYMIHNKLLLWIIWIFGIWMFGCYGKWTFLKWKQNSNHNFPTVPFLHLPGKMNTNDDIVTQNKNCTSNCNSRALTCTRTAVKFSSPKLEP